MNSNQAQDTPLRQREGLIASDQTTLEGRCCVHELFEKQAQRTPESIAVEFLGKALTYGELNERAEALATHLKSLGVGHDDRVAICLDRSLEMIAGVLGILKAGAAYVPLDPKYPAERRKLMLEDSKSRVFLTQSDWGKEMELGNATVIWADKFNWKKEVGTQSVRDWKAPDADSLAYVIYTSGSTGRPKGVAMPHRPLVNLIQWQNEQSSNLPPSARTLQFTSLSFDVSFQEIFSTLCSGGTLVLMAEELRYDPAGLWNYLRSASIHRLFLPFIALQQLAEAISQSTERADLLREVITAGEQLQITPKIQGMFQRLPKARLHNHYGPSESHVVTAFELPKEVNTWPPLPPIGRPIANSQIFVLGEQRQPVPDGEVGELYLGGECLARGYLDRPDLTEERFISSPLGSTGRLYKTGDLARILPDGNAEFLGRADDQVKIRGHRVELGEIEAVLSGHPAVKACVIMAVGDGGEKQLVAYVLESGERATADDLRIFLKGKLSEAMVPSRFIFLKEFPLTPSGKINRRALPKPEQNELLSGESTIQALPRSETENVIAAVWKEVLGRAEVGIDANFFDTGGTSLMLARVRDRLQAFLQRDVSILSLLRFPTIRGLAGELSNSGDSSAKPKAAGRRLKTSPSAEIAIVGMAGRFPGARNVEEFWKNICEGKESVTKFTDEQLLAAGGDPESLKDSAFVRARGVLADVDQFDAGFFGLTAREAEITDPQQRLFLECAWETLEDGGCNPTNFTGAIGVYGGSSLNTYFLGNVLQGPVSAEKFAQGFQVDGYPVLVGNDKDYLASRIAYKLNLRGPAVTIQTACSTSLVAVCHACAGLLAGQCDVALAGGVSISFPQERGYIYQEGAIASSDGHCRAFDEGATGTVFGAGVAMVMLKRLEDALADGDQIYAVIRGAALNNDGGDKLSFSAPSINGQAEVIQMAHAAAGISAESIGYVEAHGTGTPLGDPIEVEALTLAFRKSAAGKQFCGLGSVKTNVGHLEAAAGVTGLIKAALALKHGVIPPTLHFKKGNPKCRFEESPFFVVAELKEWARSESPRRAGVSSFGVGGTNAHVVLEEAPASAASQQTRSRQLLVLSAKSEAALQAMSDNLADHLEKNPNLPLGAAARSLMTGRKQFVHRRAVVAENSVEAISKLRAHDPKTSILGKAREQEPTVIFMFPGQGAQYVNMGRDLYESEPVFRAEVDRCASILQGHLGLDIRKVIYPEPASASEAAKQINETWITQPSIFVIEYALAQLWISWGIKPKVVVGHSIGEYVCATLAGTFTLEESLRLLSKRAKLMQQLPGGSMLAVRLKAEDVEPILPSGASIAAINSFVITTVSGPTDVLEAFQKDLDAKKIGSKFLPTSHAFHSAAMDPILPEIAAEAKTIPTRIPTIPWISSCTGSWMTQQEVADSSYWGKQLRQPVLFSKALEVALLESNAMLVEVGPGQTLTQLARQHPAKKEGLVVVTSLATGGDQPGRDLGSMLSGLGRLWASAVKTNWEDFLAVERHRTVSLPSYPFERQRFWISPEKSSSPIFASRRIDGACISPAAGAIQTITGNSSLPEGTGEMSEGVELLVRQQLAVMRAQLETLASSTDI